MCEAAGPPHRAGVPAARRQWSLSYPHTKQRPQGPRAPNPHLLSHPGRPGPHACPTDLSRPLGIGLEKSPKYPRSGFPSGRSRPRNAHLERRHREIPSPRASCLRLAHGLPSRGRRHLPETELSFHSHVGQSRGRKGRGPKGGNLPCSLLRTRRQRPVCSGLGGSSEVSVLPLTSRVVGGEPGTAPGRSNPASHRHLLQSLGVWEQQRVHSTP